MPFHGCFGIRSLSPFHLNSLNIPIQNTECPENAEIACPDIIFSPTIFLWNLNCVVFAWACQTQSVLTGNAIHESYCFVQYFVLWYVIKAESDQRVLLFLLQNMKCASMCFTHDLSFISELIKLDQPLQLNGQTFVLLQRQWLKCGPVGCPLTCLSSSSIARLLLQNQRWHSSSFKKMVGENMMSRHAF